MADKTRNKRDDITYFDARARLALIRAAHYKKEMIEALSAARGRVERVAGGKRPDFEPDAEAVGIISQAFNLDPTGAGWWDWLEKMTAKGGAK